ncbi:hypothetical protein HZ994_14485 [Akkermansiaceae bacterium]|nr:hypothetical protein HZ994_14485 [Akkermansiaceae bacterium]
MKKFLIAAVVAVLMLIPLGMWWFSPEQVIMRRTSHLMEVISMSDGSGGPMRQAKVFSMNAMLAPEVELEIPDIPDANGSFDKEEMESAFSWICQNAKRSDFRVTAFREVIVDGGAARVAFDAEGFLELGSGRPADGSFDVTIHWVKGGDGWRFHKLRWENR